MKVIIAIDSLGNLASAKELRDVTEGKDAADMGTKAKAMKSMMRALTFKAAKARVPIVFTNHIYDNPTSLYPELVKKQSGGSGPVYLASLLVQLAVRNEKIDKNEGQESIAVAHNVSGVTLSAMTVKNRFVPSFLKAELLNKLVQPITYKGKRLDTLVSGKMNLSSGKSESYLFSKKLLKRRSVTEVQAELLQKLLMV